MKKILEIRPSNQVTEVNFSFVSISITLQLKSVLNLLKGAPNLYINYYITQGTNFAETIKLCFRNPCGLKLAKLD